MWTSTKQRGITGQGTYHQDWTPGQIVKVGFMKLMVLSGPHPNEDSYLPNFYVLAGNKGATYRFTPHNGCERIS